MIDRTMTREQLRERIYSTVEKACDLYDADFKYEATCITRETIITDAIMELPAILALLPSAQGKDGGEVDQVWDALRLRCCSSGLEAKRIVMVSRADLAHALKASPSKTERTPGTFEMCVKCHLSVQDYNLKGGCGINATTCPIAAGKE